jgi:CRP-like cAMP-binding protein
MKSTEQLKLKPQLYSSSEAAQMLGVSRNTLLRWFREARIAEVSRDRNGWRCFSQSDIERIRLCLEQPGVQDQLDDFPDLCPSRQPMRQYLAKVPCFQDLDQPLLDELAKVARFVGCLKGQQLFRPGDKALGLYVVVKGEIRVFRSNFDGREQTLAVVRPFETLGESVLFAKSALHINYALCLTSSAVMLLPNLEVHQLTQASPTLARAFLAEFSHRIQSLEQRLEEQSLLSLEQRLIGLLETQEGAQLTVAQMASYLGVARESLSRRLARLVRLGVLERTSSLRVRVVDADSLRRL